MGERWNGKGRGREWVEVGGEEKGKRGSELHHNPGLDAINREYAVGRGESAKRCIVDKADGAE